MDSAEPKGQSRAERNWFCMTLPTRAAFAPPMTSGTTNMPREEMKTNTVPAAMPGIVRGRVIFRNAVTGEAPRSAAASKSLRSSCSMET